MRLVEDTPERTNSLRNQAIALKIPARRLNECYRDVSPVDERARATIVDNDDEIRRLADMAAGVGGCTARAPRGNTRLGLDAEKQPRLVLGGGPVRVLMPVLLHFCAVTVPVQVN